MDGAKNGMQNRASTDKWFISSVRNPPQHKPKGFHDAKYKKECTFLALE